MTMNYWIICLPREDIEHCLSIGVVGLGRSHTISKVRARDKVGLVISREKPWRLAALATVTSDYYVDSTKIFRKDGMFLDRFEFEVNHQFDAPGPDFQSIIPQLSVITHPAHWPVYFKMGITKITPEDWTVVASFACSGKH